MCYPSQYQIRLPSQYLTALRNQYRSLIETPSQSPEEVALVPGTLLVHRGWNVRVGGFLAAYTAQYVWESGVNKAVCQSFIRAPGHEKAPDARCTCGLYGLYDPNDVDFVDVRGVIEVSGRVTLGTRGVRAQKAKIVALATLNPMIRVRYRGVDYFKWPSAMEEKYPVTDVSALLEGRS
jgi:hypothetical protein